MLHPWPDLEVEDLDVSLRVNTDRMTSAATIHPGPGRGLRGAALERSAATTRESTSVGAWGKAGAVGIDRAWTECGLSRGGNRGRTNFGKLARRSTIDNVSQRTRRDARAGVVAKAVSGPCPRLPAPSTNGAARSANRRVAIIEGAKRSGADTHRWERVHIAGSKYERDGRAIAHFSDNRIDTINLLLQKLLGATFRFHKMLMKNSTSCPVCWWIWRPSTLCGRSRKIAVRSACAPMARSILATHSDIAPLLLVEAGYFGCPVDSTRRFAIPDIVEHGRAGGCSTTRSIPQHSSQRWPGCSRPVKTMPPGARRPGRRRTNP